MILRSLALTSLLVTVFSCSPAPAQSSPDANSAVKQNLTKRISDLLEAQAPPLDDAICSVLKDTLGAANAQGEVDTSEQTGFMGMPITCQRTYTLQQLPIRVTVYTEPQFVGRIANGPPAGQGFQSFEIAGRSVYVSPADPQGLPALMLVDAAPDAVIILPLPSEEVGGSSAELALIEAMDLGAVTKANAPQGEIADREAELQKLSQRLKDEVVARFDGALQSPDLMLDPVGTSPRCLDIAEPLFENPDFLYLSVMVGESCIASIPQPNAATSMIGSYEVYFEPTEQSFSGDFSTRGTIKISNYLVLNFQADGDQSRAEASVNELPLESLAALL